MILNYHRVKFYLELKKKEPDNTKFPLCVDIIRESMSMPNEGAYVEVIWYRVPTHHIGLHRVYEHAKLMFLVNYYDHEMPPLEVR